jgi:hypothetical protein
MEALGRRPNDDEESLPNENNVWVLVGGASASDQPVRLALERATVPAAELAPTDPLKLATAGPVIQGGSTYRSA